MSVIRHRRNSDEPTTQGVVLSPHGIVMGVPHALRMGPARPEPPDRWTLGPRPPETPAEGRAADDAADADAATEPVTTEPVDATVRRGAGGHESAPKTRHERR